MRLDLKQRIALAGIPAAVVLGGLTYTAIGAAAAPIQSPAKSASSAQSTAPESSEDGATAESTTTESTTEPVGEATPAGGGYADSNTNADTQQEGVN